MPKLTIDGKEVEVEKGANLILAAQAAGVEVPHFCYHPGLPVAGNCRMCLVEIEGSPKLQIGCNTPAADGMVVKTDTPKVAKARQGVMEFLLLNHPIDCPVCDCAGECYLQDYYMLHDRAHSRLEEGKNKKKKAEDIGPHVMLDTERCVLCSRCVRFTDFVSKSHELGIFGRGSTEQIGLVEGARLDNPYSGNVVDICPVGALTDKQFRFKSRPWYLEDAETVCDGCSQGCNIVLNTNPNPYNKVGQARAYRVYPRENAQVNQFWICDEGRYSYPSLDQGRAARAARRGLPIPWEEAVAELASGLKSALDSGGPGSVAFLLSPRLTNEELWAWARLARHLGVGQVEAGDGIKRTGGADGYLIQADKNPNSEGARLLGLGPRAGVLGAREVLKAAGEGKFSALVAVEQDLGAVLGMPAFLELAGRPGLLALVNAHESEAASRAPLFLPRAVYAEQEGSFTNRQGRVQRLRKAMEPWGDSRPAFALALQLGSALGQEPWAGDAESVFLDLARGVPEFKDMTHQALGKSGLAVKSAVAA